MATTDAGCEGCKFLCRQDDGYSNWTVMGVSLRCLKRVNPHMPASDDIESYATEQALKYGETCTARVAGDGPWFDVDGEVTNEDFKDDPEVYALLTQED